MNIDLKKIRLILAGVAIILILIAQFLKPDVANNRDITSKSTDITSTFVDENFKNEIYKLIGKTNPAKILYSDVKNLTRLELSAKNISDLSGVEYFTALIYLHCDRNNLSTLDISKNTALINLDCEFNKLTTLDVSKNKALDSLYCYDNNITTLDTSENIALKILNCESNNLTTLDVSKNASLTTFLCDKNQITTLYATKKTWTKDFYNPQYIDETHKKRINSLIVTFKN